MVFRRHLDNRIQYVIMFTLVYIVVAPLVGKIFGSSTRLIEHGIFITFISVIFVSICTLKIRRSLLVYILAVLVFFLIGLSGGYVHSVAVVMIGTVVFLKILYLMWGVSNISDKKLDYLFQFMFVYQLLGFFAQKIFPNFFQQAAGLHWQRSSGFMFDSNEFGYICASLLIYYSFVTRSNIKIAICLILLFYSNSLTGMLIFTFSACYIGSITSEKPLRTFSYLLTLSILFGTLVLVLSGDRIFHTYNMVYGAMNYEMYYPRIMMLIGGFNLSMQNFPFGAGAGYFATNLTQVYEVYDAAGISNILDVNKVIGLFDSGNGQLLGQFGFSGVFILCSLFFVMTDQRVFAPFAIDRIFFVILLFLANFALTVTSDYLQGFTLILILRCIVTLRSRRGWR